MNSIDGAIELEDSSNYTQSIDTSRLCSNCDTETSSSATWYCIDCRNDLCDECDAEVHNLRSLRKHKRNSLSLPRLPHRSDNEMDSTPMPSLFLLANSSIASEFLILNQSSRSSELQDVLNKDQNSLVLHQPVDSAENGQVIDKLYFSERCIDIGILGNLEREPPSDSGHDQVFNVDKEPVPNCVNTSSTQSLLSLTTDLGGISKQYHNLESDAEFSSITIESYNVTEMDSTTLIREAAKAIDGDHDDGSDDNSSIASFKLEQNVKFEKIEIDHLMGKQKKRHKESGSMASKALLEAQEVMALCDHINLVLKCDKHLSRYLPLNKEPGDFFNKIGDGVILCKLINCAQPGAIIESRIHTRPDMNVFQKSENITFALRAAMEMGCHVINIDSKDIIDGRRVPIMGLLWQIIKAQLLSGISLNSWPELCALVEPSEVLETFTALPADVILMRWTNYHLSRSGQAIRATNFGSDMQDGEILTTLLHQLEPQLCSTYDRSQPPTECVVQILESAARMRVSTFVRPENILSGNSKFIMGFVAQIFNACHGLPRVAGSATGRARADSETKLDKLEKIVMLSQAKSSSGRFNDLLYRRPPPHPGSGSGSTSNSTSSSSGSGSGNTGGGSHSRVGVERGAQEDLEFVELRSGIASADEVIHGSGRVARAVESFTGLDEEPMESFWQPAHRHPSSQATVSVVDSHEQILSRRDGGRPDDQIGNDGDDGGDSRQRMSSKTFSDGAPVEIQTRRINLFATEPDATDGFPADTSSACTVQVPTDLNACVPTKGEEEMAFPNVQSKIDSFNAFNADESTIGNCSLGICGGDGESDFPEQGNGRSRRLNADRIAIFEPGSTGDTPTATATGTGDGKGETSGQKQQQQQRRLSVDRLSVFEAMREAQEEYARDLAQLPPSITNAHFSRKITPKSLRVGVKTGTEMPGSTVWAPSALKSINTSKSVALPTNMSNPREISNYFSQASIRSVLSQPQGLASYSSDSTCSSLSTGVSRGPKKSVRFDLTETPPRPVTLRVRIHRASGAPHTAPAPLAVPPLEGLFYAVTTFIIVDGPLGPPQGGFYRLSSLIEDEDADAYADNVDAGGACGSFGDGGGNGDGCSGGEVGRGEESGDILDREEEILRRLMAEYRRSLKAQQTQDVFVAPEASADDDNEEEERSVEGDGRGRGECGDVDVWRDAAGEQSDGVWDAYIDPAQASPAQPYTGNHSHHKETREILRRSRSHEGLARTNEHDELKGCGQSEGGKGHEGHRGVEEDYGDGGRGSDSPGSGFEPKNIGNSFSSEDLFIPTPTYSNLFGRADSTDDLESLGGDSDVGSVSSVGTTRTEDAMDENDFIDLSAIHLALEQATSDHERAFYKSILKDFKFQMKKKKRRKVKEKRRLKKAAREAYKAQQLDQFGASSSPHRRCTGSFSSSAASDSVDGSWANKRMPTQRSQRPPASLSHRADYSQQQKLPKIQDPASPSRSKLQLQSNPASHNMQEVYGPGGFTEDRDIDGDAGCTSDTSSLSFDDVVDSHFTKAFLNTTANDSTDETSVERAPAWHWGWDDSDLSLSSSDSSSAAVGKRADDVGSDGDEERGEVEEKEEKKEEEAAMDDPKRQKSLRIDNTALLALLNSPPLQSAAVTSEASHISSSTATTHPTESDITFTPTPAAKMATPQTSTSAPTLKSSTRSNRRRPGSKLEEQDAGRGTGERVDDEIEDEDEWVITPSSSKGCASWSDLIKLAGGFLDGLIIEDDAAAPARASARARATPASTTEGIRGSESSTHVETIESVESIETELTDSGAFDEYQTYDTSPDVHAGNQTHEARSQRREEEGEHGKKRFDERKGSESDRNGHENRVVDEQYVDDTAKLWGVRAYKVTYPAGVNIRVGVELTSRVVCVVPMGQIVLIDQVALSSDGIQRLRLTDGRGWTSLHAGADSKESYLVEVPVPSAGVPSKSASAVPEDSIIVTDESSDGLAGRVDVYNNDSDESWEQAKYEDGDVESQDKENGGDDICAVDARNGDGDVDDENDDGYADGDDDDDDDEDGSEYDGMDSGSETSSSSGGSNSGNMSAIDFASSGSYLKPTSGFRRLLDTLTALASPGPTAVRMDLGPDFAAEPAGVEDGEGATADDSNLWDDGHDEYVATRRRTLTGEETPSPRAHHCRQERVSTPSHGGATNLLSAEDDPQLLQEESKYADIVVDRSDSAGRVARRHRRRLGIEDRRRARAEKEGGVAAGGERSSAEEEGQIVVSNKAQRPRRKKSSKNSVQLKAVQAGTPPTLTTPSGWISCLPGILTKSK